MRHLASLDEIHLDGGENVFVCADFWIDFQDDIARFRIGIDLGQLEVGQHPELFLKDACVGFESGIENDNPRLSSDRDGTRSEGYRLWNGEDGALCGISGEGRWAEGAEDHARGKKRRPVLSKIFHKKLQRSWLREEKLFRFRFGFAWFSVVESVVSGPRDGSDLFSPSK